MVMKAFMEAFMYIKAKPINFICDPPEYFEH